jgi:hypothetical protein
MVEYDEIRRHDDEIRDRHRQELDKVHTELDRDLKRKLRRLYIVSFIVFVLMCIFYLVL